MQQDYNYYFLSMKEWLIVIGEYLLLTGVIAYLFYKSCWGLIIGILLYPSYLHMKKKDYVRKRKLQFGLQFKDCLVCVAGAMRAGYSVENAWKEAAKDMERQYGRNSDIVRELRKMNNQVGFNVPIEGLLENLAYRTHIEDIENFSSIFTFAKRSGGDFTTIISNSVRQLADKMELQNQIETAFSAKRMEQKVMNLVPLFILAFMNLTSREFLATLYHNLAGILIMSVCLLVYAGAYLWAEKIVDIEV